MNLTNQQLAAATSPAPRLLISAGPGSGKSTTLIARVNHLVEMGADPRSIAMITFTRAGARVFEERLPFKIGYAGTLHSFLLNMLKRHGKPIGFTERLTVIDEDQAKALLDQIVAECRYSGTTEELKKALQTYWPESNWNRTKTQVCALAYHRHLVRCQVIDFDSVLTMGICLLARHEGPLRLGRVELKHLLVDEVQDSSPQDHEVYELLEVDTLTMVGDVHQCQPGDTVVKTARGDVRMDQLVDGDCVTSYDRHAGRLTGGHKIKVASHKYHGDMLSVFSFGMRADSTPNHYWLTRFSDREDSVCVTYLMYRADLGFRVGWCQLFNRSTKGNHFFKRCNLESADAGWVLGVHKNRTDASVEESIIAGKYGIPTVTFRECQGAQHMLKESISKIFAGVGDRTLAAISLLNSFGRRIDCPFFEKGSRTIFSNGSKRLARNTIMKVHACNLLPGVMKIPNTHGAWELIDMVTTNEFSGMVYSLDVEKHHNYIANGLVTMNSLFKFRGGAPELMANLAKDQSFEIHKLLTNHRSTQPIVEACNRLVRDSQIPMEMVSANGPGPAIEVRGFQTMGQEGAWIAQQVLAGGLGQCAVLLRTNALVRQYADALAAAGVSVARRVTVKWPADWSQGRLALAVLNDPDNDWLASRWLTATGRDGAAALDEAAGEAMSVNQLSLCIKRCDSLAGLPEALAGLGISRESVALMVKIAEEDQVSDIPALIEAIAEHIEDSEEIGSGVHVGTIHGAKGREWDTVFLPAFENEVIPAGRDLDEERRVAFVGVSRARFKVFITGCDRRVSEYKGPYETTWSRFIEDMGLAVP